jgi:exodeoxyribonuclease I
MKTNALPIVAPHRGQAIEGVDLKVAQARLTLLQQHPTFASTVARAMAATDEDFEPPAHVEQSIYGSFPSRSDQKLMEDFHRLPWPQRYALLSRFDDRRYEEFGERIIYAEHPEGLPPERLEALKAWHRDRHLTEDDVPWQTIKKARDELQQIKDEIAADQTNETALIAEIEEYLSGLLVAPS